MAASVALAIDQGTSFRRILTIKDNTDPQAPVVVNITGYLFRAQARAAFSSTSPAFTFGFAVRTQTGSDVGKVDMSLQPEDTATIAIAKPTDYFYDVEMESPDGEIRRIFQGTITMSPEVTK